MSQDSQEIKTIEQWRWSEMQGLELVSASPSPSSEPFKGNPLRQSPMTSTTTTTTTEAESSTRLEQQEEGETQVGLKREEAMENGEPPIHQDSNGGGGGGGSSSSGSGSSGEKPEAIPAVGFGDLFRFADGLDYVLMTIGSIGAFVHGCSLPLFLRFFADLVNSFGSNANNMDKMMQEVLKVCIRFTTIHFIFLSEKKKKKLISL